MSRWKKEGDVVFACRTNPSDTLLAGPTPGGKVRLHALDADDDGVSIYLDKKDAGALGALLVKWAHS